MQTCLPRCNHSISYVAMARNSHLPRQDDILPHMRRARKANLGAEQGVLANARSVAYLH